jgi:hypothetical protein
LVLALVLGCASGGPDTSSKKAKKDDAADQKKTTAEGDLETDEDGDLPADEPAHVAGSYLFCEEIPETATATTVEGGCTLMDSSDNTVDLKKNDYDPEISNMFGVVTPLSIEHFTGKPKYHWEVTVATADLTCKMFVKLIIDTKTFIEELELKIKDKNGEYIEIKECDTNPRPEVLGPK